MESYHKRWCINSAGVASLTLPGLREVIQILRVRL